MALRNVALLDHLLDFGREFEQTDEVGNSRAIDLHADSIQVSVKNWSPPSRAGKRVLFRPFVGVAPRMYRRAFMKDRDLKNPMFGQLQQGEPDWGTPWHLRAVSYSDLEAKLAES